MAINLAASLASGTNCASGATDDRHPVTDPGQPLHLALAGYEHEWPADFEAFVARELIGRDGALVARLAELSEAPAFLPRVRSRRSSSTPTVWG